MNSSDTSNNKSQLNKPDLNKKDEESDLDQIQRLNRKVLNMMNSVDLSHALKILN